MGGQNATKSLRFKLKLDDTNTTVTTCALFTNRVTNGEALLRQTGRSVWMTLVQCEHQHPPWWCWSQLVCPGWG